MQVEGQRLMKSELDTFVVRLHRNAAETLTGEAERMSANGLASGLRRISSSRLFNSVSGVLPAAIFFLFLVGHLNRLGRLFGESQYAGTDMEFYATVMASISKTLFLLLVVLLFLFRRQPVSKAQGIMPRFMAMVGTWLLLLLMVLPTPEPSLLQSVIGLVLVGVGGALSAVAVSFLGRSLSIMPEARNLVTHGAYSVVRHPLYLAEEIAAVGMIVQLFSLSAVLLLVSHIAVQIQRMKYEEAVLTRAFPEYETYMAHTCRVIPGIY